MINSDQPYLIEFDKIGSSSLGYLTALENSKLPFLIKRAYWTYYAPDDVVRGHHAHYELQQIIIAVCGEIEFTLESIEGELFKFELKKPFQGLYIPRLFWRTIKFSHNAVLLCLASEEFSEDDYIRSYKVFKSLVGK